MIVVLLSIGRINWSSLCNSPDCPGTRYVEQTSLELTEIRVPLLLCARIKGVLHDWLAKDNFWIREMA